jgi:hypothetical protein
LSTYGLEADPCFCAARESDTDNRQKTTNTLEGETAANDIIIMFWLNQIYKIQRKIIVIRKKGVGQGHDPHPGIWVLCPKSAKKTLSSFLYLNHLTAIFKLLSAYETELARFHPTIKKSLSRDEIGQINCVISAGARLLCNQPGTRGKSDCDLARNR